MTIQNSSNDGHKTEDIKRRILIIDDEARVLSSLSRQLRGEFDVFTLTNAMDALHAIARGHDFPVIISDQQMPIMSGIEFFRRVQDISPGSVRIMLTGNSDQETPVAAVNQAGIYRFLTKPCDTDHLIAAINDGYERFHAQNSLIEAAANGNTAEVARNEILNNMAHEFRTPLNHIIGFAELLQSGNLNDEQSSEYAEIIRGSGTDLLSEINNLLDLAMMRAGELTLNRSTVPVQDLMGYATRLIENEFGDRDITFRTAVYGNFPMLEIDEELFQNAVSALISNVVKFNPPGTTIYMAALLDGQGRPVIEIADDGVGIPKSKQSEVFQPFSQGDGSISREQEGCGLGLPLTCGIIEMHGGRMELESEVECGTVIRLTLPFTAIVRSADVIPFERIAGRIKGG